ncbi:hypothetical protein TSAR_011449 [Trichomalopsis sarcophagae]|uniref:Mediator of RNA polymerase II transcription subunit 27 n=1 Tax=Trichomalopsis sarcophagae TaxID=543379 RepID=A0A232EZH6_9HYME|nr:hypothetical protein TSAR_011449 [Trichomalopsis sarcophagae]
MEQLQTALSTLKVLRSSVGQVFYSLANGIRADHGEENKENKYLLELQELLTTVGTNLRDVEQAVNSLNPPPGPFNLGNTAYLAQETTQDRQALYGTLVNVYKWTDKAHEYSNVAHQILSQNSLKRSSMSSNRAKRSRVQAGAHNSPPQQVDQVMASFDRLYSDMSITITRPYTSNAVIHVTLGHVLKAIIAFKGLMMERVVIKGYNEELDLWTESRYKVFQRVTDHAHAAMLHFYNPNFPELTLKSFFAWFHSFISLFNDPCKRCGLYLYGALPPTWRDPKSLGPYHFECKP